MADEIKKIITIDTRESARNLRTLQEAVDKAKVDLLKFTGAEEERQQLLVKLKAAQAEYNKEMRMAVKEESALTEETNKAGESYNDLLNKLNRLKDAWKSTGDEAKRAELSAQINGVKGQLDELDHSIGNWQRGVGSYENAIVAALNRIGIGFKGIGLSAQSIIPTIKGVGAALWALAKNPFVIGLSALVALFNKLRKSLKGNEDAFDRIRIALAPLQVVTIKIQQLFDKLVGSIANAAEGVGRFLEKIGLVKGTAAELKSLAQEEDDIEELRREYRKREAADRKEANRLRAEERKTNKYTAEERKQMLQDAIALEMGIGQRREELARREADIQKRRAALTANSRETNDSLAESEAAVDEAMAATYASMGRVNSRLNSLEENTNGAADATKKLAQETDALADAILREIDAEEKEFIAGSFAAEKTANTNRRKGFESRLAGVGAVAVNAEVNARAEIDDAEKLAAELYRIRKESNEQRLKLLKEFAEQARQAGDLETYLSYEKQAADLSVKIEQDAVTEKARLRREDEKDAERSAKQQIKAAQSVANIMGSVASAYQAYLTQRVEGGKMSEEAAEKEFENVKAIQYAQTWINALAGSVSVWAGEGTNLTKAVQSAAVLAQGIAATMQIANTTLGSVSAATKAVTSAAVAAPVVINAMPQVQALTSASQEEALNARSEAQRVYVVYSDIAQAGKKVQVTQGESRF